MTVVREYRMAFREGSSGVVVPDVRLVSVRHVCEFVCVCDLVSYARISVRVNVCVRVGKCVVKCA